MLLRSVARTHTERCPPKKKAKGGGIWCRNRCALLDVKPHMSASPFRPQLFGSYIVSVAWHECTRSSGHGGFPRVGKRLRDVARVCGASGREHGLAMLVERTRGCDA